MSYSSATRPVFSSGSRWTGVCFSFHMCSLHVCMSLHVQGTHLVFYSLLSLFPWEILTETGACLSRKPFFLSVPCSTGWVTGVPNHPRLYVGAVSSNPGPYACQQAHHPLAFLRDGGGRSEWFGVFSFPPCESQQVNSGAQAWQWEPLPSEPSWWPLVVLYFEF